jgi:hypothetical protein
METVPHSRGEELLLFSRLFMVYQWWSMLRAGGGRRKVVVLCTGVHVWSRYCGWRDCEESILCAYWCARERERVRVSESEGEKGEL